MKSIIATGATALIVAILLFTMLYIKPGPWRYDIYQNSHEVRRVDRLNGSVQQWDPNSTRWVLDKGQ